MIKKINLLLSVLSVCTLIVAHAQVTASSVAINGTPYLNEKYEEGVIHFADKRHTAPIRYNAFQDLIEYQQNGKPLVLDPNETIKKVRFGNSTFVPLPFESKGKQKLGYFEVLDSGKVTLYSRKKVIFLDAKKGGALDGSDQPAQYKRSPDTFYYRIGDGDLKEIENMKEMIASFPDKQEELTQFAKKEKISPRKEKEIIQFIHYYNSL
jgi:hypothetical protein